MSPQTGRLMSERAMSRAEVRDVDRRAIEEFRLSGVVLMENAGRGCAELLVSLGITGPVIICAGKGNNGGDGFVIARHLENRGFQVQVLLFCDPVDLKGDALINYRVIEAAGTSVNRLGTQPDREELDRLLDGVDWIVDGLLGTGTQGSIREPYVTAIDAINRANAKVLAVDLPSGMDCDTGESLGCCVRADHTATFVAYKLGFDSEEARAYTGIVHVIDIGVPRSMLEE